MTETRDPLFPFQLFFSRCLLVNLLLSIFSYLVLFFLITCPNYFHLFCLMTMLIFSISALRLTLCGNYFFKILLRLLCMNVSTMISTFLVTFQVSLSYRRTDRMLELNKQALFPVSWSSFKFLSEVLEFVLQMFLVRLLLVR